MLLFNNVKIIRPENCYATVADCNVFKGVWKSGFHYASACVGIQYLVTKQALVYDMPAVQVTSQDNVIVEFDVALLIEVV